MSAAPTACPCSTGRGCAGCGRENRSQRIGKVRILEGISERQRFRRRHALTGGDDLGHFAECQLEQLVRRPQRDVEAPRRVRLFENAENVLANSALRTGWGAVPLIAPDASR